MYQGQDLTLSCTLI